MKKNIITFLKTFGLFILLFTFTPILFNIFNIDINSLSKEKYYFLLFFSDFIFIIIIFFAYKDTIINDFKNFFLKNFTNNIETSFKYWLIGFIIMIISNLIIVVIKDVGIATNEEVVREMIDKAPLYMLFSVSLYAPFTEEIIFRKSFSDIFKNKFLYVFISGVTFGTLHVISSIDSWYSLLHLIPYCSLGISFALLYYKTKNIFSTITMHMIHNTLAIGIYFIGSGL